MLVTTHLDRGIGRLVCWGARWKCELREEPVRRTGDSGDGTSSELGRRGDENLLDLGMGGLSPVRSERCH